MTVEMAVAMEIGAYAVDGDNAAVLFALLVVVVVAAAVQVVVKDVIAVDAVGVALDLAEVAEVLVVCSFVVVVTMTLLKHLEPAPCFGLSPFANLHAPDCPCDFNSSKLYIFLKFGVPSASGNGAPYSKLLHCAVLSHSSLNCKE